ncbi:Leucine rich repeat-containing protein [Chryseobacterium soldanellicola]|uniref:Leucine rich repeat-containing protein n=1 Tax=Chryseobacterium soldanellicola TaxID=311333 RepID=A0A1H1AFD9_9FLAO|nr:leucine-rich repeat domain-containing protein [Chryseobacterium soldanellicola]SDQ38374.1 Leucine rich repeat-containing protein [Chryseobacterium soldanellicola]
MKTKEELKLYFENGDQPKQEHFWHWLDSYWHKEEKISQNSIGFVEKICPLIVNDEFKGSYLSVTIPDNVKKIADYAYLYYGFVAQVFELNLNEGLIEIGQNAFNGQNIKKIITPSTLKIVQPYAFYNQVNTYNSQDSLESIVLNEGLTTVGEKAFNCSAASVIKNLDIPSTVRSVGQNAFAIPSLETVSAPAGLDLRNSGIPATATITYRGTEPLQS